MFPASPFDNDIAKARAEDLRHAVRGPGYKASTIKDVLVEHTVLQRLMIVDAYKELYNKVRNDKSFDFMKQHRKNLSKIEKVG